MAEKKKLSVAEILAAARKADSGGGPKAAQQSAETSAEPSSAEPAPQPAEPAAEAPAPAAKPAAAKPPAKAPAAKPGERPNVADILAAARAGKKPETAPAAKPSEPAPVAESAEPAPRPAKKPAAKAPAKEKPAEAPAVSAEKDTASILAAARTGTKPGPMSKSEAAAMSKPAAPAAPAKAAKPKVSAPPMPPKPDYAKPKEKAVVEEDRRFFVLAAVGSFLALGFTTLTATITLWTLGTARFMFPNILTEPPSKFKVGFPADFPPGYVENKFKAQYGIWVVNTEYNGLKEIFALSTVCTHLGCTPNWLDGEQKFKCPCHGSGFYKDGINFEGPAPRPLERYAIRLSDDGQLEVDKSKKFQEELGQWNDTASFVPV